jgi:hypothetical protein
MTIRKSSFFLVISGCCLSVLAFLLIYQPGLHVTQPVKTGETMPDLVRRYELTDLCLFTDARYTRHLSQADLHSAFQDYPLAFDYFPSGSVVQPLPLIHGE